MSAANIKLSVIIACGRPAALLACLEGFKRQRRLRDFEVIVVGDTGGIEPAAYGFALTAVPCAQTHPNIRRNLGLQKAASPLIAFMDDDAVPDEGWVDAALEQCDPDGGEVLTGPEAPPAPGPVGRLVYAVSCSYFSEASRAHVNRRRSEVGWRDVPFCNCVLPRRLIEASGGLAARIPWDMDDFHFFRGLRGKAAFLNIPELSIKHDRYPESAVEFLRYKWRLRLRTGEKIVTHPGTYLGIAPLALAAGLPWAFAAAAAASPALALRLAALGAAVYALLLALQLKEAAKHGPRGGALYLALFPALHAVSLSALQAGIFRALYQKAVLKAGL